MSVNTAALDQSEENPVLLSEERILHQSEGVRLSLESGGGYPGAGGNFYCPSGRLLLTNYRAVYLPRPKLQFLKSVAIPLANIHDIQVRQPFFGPNEVEAVVAPMPNGGLLGPAQMKLTFIQGGAIEFHSIFTHFWNTNAGNLPKPPEEALPLYTAAPADSHQTVLSSPTTAATQPRPNEPPPAYSPPTQP